MGAYLRRKPGFTLAGWKRDHWSDNTAVAAQRERMAGMLRDLGVPDGMSGPPYGKRSRSRQGRSGQRRR